MAPSAPLAVVSSPAPLNSYWCEIAQPILLFERTENIKTRPQPALFLKRVLSSWGSKPAAAPSSWNHSRQGRILAHRVQRASRFKSAVRAAGDVSSTPCAEAAMWRRSYRFAFLQAERACAEKGTGRRHISASSWG